MRDSLITWTHAIYALHAVSLITGIITAASVVAAFLTGWPSLIAVVLNYVKRSEVRGTWLESHFRWQIRTFWYGLLWVAQGTIPWRRTRRPSAGAPTSSISCIPSCRSTSPAPEAHQKSCCSS
jgi:uncharacterized membrane protein